MPKQSLNNSNVDPLSMSNVAAMWGEAKVPTHCGLLTGKKDKVAA
jgi:hypothetical protein